MTTMAMAQTKARGAQGVRMKKITNGAHLNILYYIMLCYVILYYIILYYIILYCIVLYCIILYYIILYYICDYLCYTLFNVVIS